MSAKVVLITGCSTGGIGFALCEEFAERGCRVYASARNVEKMTSFAHSSIMKIALDVNSDDDVQRAVQHILEQEGRIDIVINNAGMLCIGPLIDISLEKAKQTFDTNTFSALRTSRAVFPAMASRRSGLIINIGSIAAEIPTPWNGMYSASKAALHALTEVLAMEAKPLGVSVFLVSPGAVRSNISRNHAAIFTLPEDTLYTSFMHNIVRRMHASQGPNAIPAEVFARRVVDKALLRDPPRYMTLGGNARLFKFLKMLPRVWALWFIWRLYSKTK